MEIEKKREAIILDVIPVGKENALHQEQLADLLGVTREAVKNMVRNARRNGTEILSGSCGYYFAKDDTERREFIAIQSKQAYTRLKTIKPINCTLKEIKGQMSITDTLENISEEGKKWAGAN